MIQDVLKTMIEYFGNDILRINHALKVYGFASTICRSETANRDTIDIIEIAAVLHDIGIHVSEKKYKSSAGKYQEIEGPPIARKMLEKLEVKQEIIERVYFLIGNHHSYSKINGLDFQILVEADFLVNIFEDELNKKMLASIREKYFKTKTGKILLDTIYDEAIVKSEL
jgi:HD superfamily phosphodiesterase